MTIDTTISPSTAPITPADLLETLATYRDYTPLADATERAYRYDLSAFESWCEENDRQAMPATPDDLAAYLAALVTPPRTLKSSSIERRCHAIAHAHEEAGHPSPFCGIARECMAAIRLLV